jgi:hypothetical protein
MAYAGPNQNSLQPRPVWDSSIEPTVIDVKPPRNSSGPLKAELTIGYGTIHFDSKLMEGVGQSGKPYRFIALPAIPQFTKNGQIVEDPKRPGKQLYRNVLSFKSKEAADRFQAAALASYDKFVGIAAE